ncbi:MAG: Gfo/Idh/MocA family oxidoreductase [Spirochaetia bacterium]|nr:Gfo/Idh/MocA family oxidoreductase [Spirochaetia bacterium]
MKNAQNTRKNISVIGTGRIAFLLEEDKLRYKPCTHIGALCNLKNKGYQIEFNNLCDINTEKLTKLKNYLIKENISVQNTTFTDNFEDIFNQINTDILIISSTTNTHSNILQTAMVKNIPHIIVEKPIVMNKEHVKQIRKLSKESKSKIWINYERRFHPVYNKILKIIEENQLGHVYHYRGILASKASELFIKNQTEGLLLHDTTHILDLAFYLFGRGKLLNILKKTKKENTHSLNLLHAKKNITGQILTIRKANFFHLEMDIFFERGRIRAGNGFFIIEKSKNSKYYSNFQSLKEEFSSTGIIKSVKENPFIRLYENVLLDKEPENILEDSLCNVDILLS